MLIIATALVLCKLRDSICAYLKASEVLFPMCYYDLKSLSNSVNNRFIAVRK
jgi:hypothetical protein